VAARECAGTGARAPGMGESGLTRTFRCPFVFFCPKVRTHPEKDSPGWFRAGAVLEERMDLGLKRDFHPHLRSTHGILWPVLDADPPGVRPSIYDD